MIKPKGKHEHKRLTDLQIRKMSKAGRYGDGNGLHLVVTPSGSKQWVLRIMVNGRRPDIGLGGYPIVSLTDARKEAIRMKNLAREGIDPIAERDDRKRIVPTFEDAAREVHRINSKLLKTEKQAKQWIAILEKYCFPKIGNMRIDDIRISHILSILEPIWIEKHSTANKLRQRISKVFDWAKTKEYITHENPVRGIKEGLPNVINPRKHFAALSYTDITDFLSTLKASTQTPNVKLGLEFLILTACRSCELRNATWDEIDYENKLWKIPAERMKAGIEHHVPLTERALEILSEVKKLWGKSKLLFPSSQSWKKVMSDMTLSASLKRMGFAVTVHGFRSTFRDWASETRYYPNDVVEMALAHSNPNKTEAAYKRGTLFEKRKIVMDDWSAYCNDSIVTHNKFQDNTHVQP